MEPRWQDDSPGCCVLTWGMQMWSHLAFHKYSLHKTGKQDDTRCHSIIYNLMPDAYIFVCSASTPPYVWGNPKLGRAFDLFPATLPGPMRCTCPSFWILREGLTNGSQSCGGILRGLSLGRALGCGACPGFYYFFFLIEPMSYPILF